MAIEIERKFLVEGENWRQLGVPEEIRQGYLAREPHCVVRVRVSGGKAWLTVKGRVSGIARPEYEVEIPVGDGREMLEGLCLKPLMEKRRTRIPFGGVIWEVDEFFGENSGLVVAEVELESVDQTVEMPEWVGAEVTGDPRYYNSNLLVHPFRKWTQ
jgi:adenylate cyclase